MTRVTEPAATGALAGAVAVLHLGRSRVAGRRDPCIVNGTFGVYLNLVEGLLWVQDVVRSNRTTPTDCCLQLESAACSSSTKAEPVLLPSPPA